MNIPIFVLFIASHHRQSESCAIVAKMIDVTKYSMERYFCGMDEQMGYPCIYYTVTHACLCVCGKGKYVLPIFFIRKL